MMIAVGAGHNHGRRTSREARGRYDRSLATTVRQRHDGRGSLWFRFPNRGLWSRLRSELVGNSTTIPAIAGPGALIISDEYNHSSIRFGARLTGAAIRQYKHNDMEDLEHLLRECISQGMPRTHRPWKKIFLMVEGLYSMEGTLVNLPKVLELRDRYKVSRSL